MWLPVAWIYDMIVYCVSIKKCLLLENSMFWLVGLFYMSHDCITWSKCYHGNDIFISMLSEFPLILLCGWLKYNLFINGDWNELNDCIFDTHFNTLSSYNVASSLICITPADTWTVMHSFCLLKISEQKKLIHNKMDKLSTTEWMTVLNFLLFVFFCDFIRKSGEAFLFTGIILFIFYYKE